jgi:hypothetical protein
MPNDSILRDVKTKAFPTVVICEQQQEEVDRTDGILNAQLIFFLMCRVELTDTDAGGKSNGRMRKRKLFRATCQLQDLI